MKRIHFLSLSVCLLASFLGPVLYADGSYYGGNGTVEDPYQIATADQLIELGRHTEDYADHFVLVADIDLGINAPGGKIFRQAVIAPETDNMTDEFQGTPFSGTFDGQGHTITDLKFEYANMQYLGLFGLIDPAGTVANLHLENCVILNPFSNTSRYGALAGENQGFIYNCAATVELWASSNGEYVGGLVGYNIGEIVNCHTAGIVDGDISIGGLVGLNDGGLIQQCSSSCEVEGYLYIGGLIGRITNYTLIIYSYATGSVSGSNYIGGLVGLSMDSTVSQCYATGSYDATGTSFIFAAGLVASMNYTIVEYCYSAGERVSIGAGLIGYADSSTTRVSYSFWDTDTSGTNSSDGGTGLPTSEMQSIISYVTAGWDFDTVWNINNGKSYPFFIWQNQTEAVLCRDGAPHPVGDFNKDCMVDLNDFVQFSEHWLEDIRQ